MRPWLWLGALLVAGLLGVAGLRELAISYAALLLVCVVGALLYLPVFVLYFGARALKGARAERAYRRRYGMASGVRSRWWG